MRILFIEDNPDFLSIVSALLRDEKHKVVEINNADDAVKAVENDTSNFDLVILDIMMMLGTIINENEAPETGIAIYKRLRKRNKSIRVLVLTALSKKDIWRHFETDNNVTYFGKPIPSDTKKFLDIVEGR
ncbi:response regulator [Methylomonas sp. HW2-6]|uniref:response regulator n=1 Tax=Methylomonas sp. HW2-6 TaxID=3376687 RepID=UPI0040422E94